MVPPPLIDLDGLKQLKLPAISNESPPIEVEENGYPKASTQEGLKTLTFLSLTFPLEAPGALMLVPYWLVK